MLKAKKLYGFNQDNNSINPELLTYIQKVQSDNEKIKRLSQANTSIQVGRVITNKLINIDSNLNDNMTYDKENRGNAKKGLLFLLNNLSGGTFCPEIETYFNQLKDLKIEELKHKTKKLEKISVENGKNNDRFKNSVDNKEINKKYIKNEQDNSYNVLQSKTKKNPYNRGINNNEEINEEYGLKKYRDDMDAIDLAQFYDKSEIKDYTFQINYNKEKARKLKLKQGASG